MPRSNFDRQRLQLACHVYYFILSFDKHQLSLGMKLYEIIPTWRSEEGNGFSLLLKQTRNHQVTMRKVELEQKEVLSYTMCGSKCGVQCHSI